MRVLRWGAVLGLWCVVSMTGGCRQEPASSFDSNLAPETYVSYAPAESTLSFYRVRLLWNGADPDGVVNHYEYAVTDSNKVPGEDTPGFEGYFRTEKTDSLFILKADNPQLLGHRFYVRAVDNQGKKDPSPAWAYFVAHDYNFPSVYFLRGKGIWTRRDGSLTSSDLTSNNRFVPWDTIGVGGRITVAWCGYDLDFGSFNPGSPCRPRDIVGYQYRASTDQQYRGGTQADTSFALDFNRDPGTPLNKWFSGTEVLRVRAIDEAGASTNPDSIRSVVVNFDPITRILDAGDPASLRRLPSFLDRDYGTRWPSGTTLALNTRNRNIQFFFTAQDDERDMSLNPGNPSGITGFGFRRVTNGGGLAFREITGWQAYPTPNAYAPNEAGNLASGDYHFLIRARDELGRWGRPDTVAVSVNYTPYVAAVNYVNADTVETPLWNPGGPTPVTVTVHRDAFGFYPDLEIRIQGSDEHDPNIPNPRDHNQVVEAETGSIQEYRASLNGDPSTYVLSDGSGPFVRFYPVSEAGGPGVVQPGVNRLDIGVKDVPGRTGILELVFIGLLER